MSTETQQTENVKFYTVSEFKSLIGATELRVLYNDKSKKKFVSANGETFKAQKDLDLSKELKFRVDGDNIQEGCLINVNGGAQTLGTL